MQSKDVSDFIYRQSDALTSHTGSAGELDSRGVGLMEGALLPGRRPSDASGRALMDWSLITVPVPHRHRGGRTTYRSCE